MQDDIVERLRETDSGHPECDQRLREAAATILSLREQLEAGGWVVGNGSKTKWRTWERGYSEWTDDLSKATRYYSREDAEAVHAEDEDAWCIVAFSTLQQIKDTPA